MRIISFIDQPEVIKKILQCLEGQILAYVLSLFNLFILSAVQDFCVTETGPAEAG